MCGWRDARVEREAADAGEDVRNREWVGGGVWSSGSSGVTVTRMW